MKQTISVVIPCYKSETYLERTVNGIIDAFKSQNDYHYQLILIDDGSSDDTFGVIKSLAAENSKIVGIALSKNYGQAQARLAALDYIKGEIVVFMDDDGQHPPEAIFSLVEKINDGNDLVYARFPELKENFLRRISSGIANRTMSILTKKPREIKITSFFALSPVSLKALKNYKSPYVFTGGYLFGVTKRVSDVKVEQSKRATGQSGYTFSKLYSLFFNNLLAFPDILGKLARVSGYIALIIAIMLVIASIVLRDLTFLILSLNVFTLAVVLILFGIFGEILIRLYNAVQGVKAFNIREVIRCEDVETSQSDH